MPAPSLGWLAAGWIQSQAQVRRLAHSPAAALCLAGLVALPQPAEQEREFGPILIQGCQETGTRAWQWSQCIWGGWRSRPARRAA